MPVLVVEVVVASGVVVKLSSSVLEIEPEELEELDELEELELPLPEDESTESS